MVICVVRLNTLSPIKASLSQTMDIINGPVYTDIKSPATPSLLKIHLDVDTC